MNKPSSDEIKLFAVSILIFTTFIHWGGVNAWSRYDLTKSVVENQSFDISEYSYNTMDKVVPKSEFLTQRERPNITNSNLSSEEKFARSMELLFNKDSLRIYTDKAPLSSFLAIPGYIAAEAFGVHLDLSQTGEWVEKDIKSMPVNIAPQTFLHQLFIVFTVSVLSGAVLVTLVYRHLIDYVSGRTALYSSLIFAFATPLTYYATNFLGVINAALFGFASYIVLEKSVTKEDVKLAVLSGIICSFSISTEYYAGLFAAGIALYLVLKRAWYRLRDFSFGLFLGAIPLLLYHWVVTGNPIMPALVSDQLVGPGPIKASCSVYSACHGTLLFAGVVPDPVRAINATLRLLFFESRGLFFYSPILLASIPGVYELYKRDKKLLIPFPGFFFMFLLFQAVRLNWLAGASFGPRYALVALPFLMLPVALGLEKLLNKGNLYRIFALLIVLVSVFNTAIAFNDGVGVVTNDAKYSEAFTSFSSVQPEFYDDLTGEFSTYGARSELLMSLTDRFKGLDLTYASPYGAGEFKLFSALNHDLLFKTAFIPLISALAVLSLVFRKQSLLFSRLLPVLIIILAVFSLQAKTDYISSETHIGGGYQAAVDEEVKVIFRVDEGEVPYIKLRTSSPGDQSYNVTSLLNGKKYRNFNVSGKDMLYFPGSKNGRNVIELSTDKCIIPAEVKEESNDRRCLSLIIEEIGKKSSKELGSFILLDGWHQSGKFSESAWMKSKGSIGFKADKGGFLSLDMVRYSAIDERKVDVLLNGEEAFFLRKNSKLVVPAEQSQSWGRLTIRSSNCVVPSEVSNSSDDRCLSYNLKNIGLDPNGIFHGDGWHDVEQKAGNSWRWMSDKAKLFVYSSEPRNLSLSVRAFSGLEDAELEILQDNQSVNNLSFKQSNSKDTDVPIGGGLSAIEFRSSEGCTIPAKVDESSNDDRCLSFRFSDLSISRGRTNESQS